MREYKKSNTYYIMISYFLLQIPVTKGENFGSHDETCISDNLCNHLKEARWSVKLSGMSSLIFHFHVNVSDTVPDGETHESCYPWRNVMYD